MSYLNFNEIGQRCPSALTQEPSNHLSDIYRFIPTTEVIDLLGEQGWLPTQAMQTRTRKGYESKTPFKKHMLRFRNENNINSNRRINWVIHTFSNIHNHGNSKIRNTSIHRH